MHDVDHFLGFMGVAPSRFLVALDAVDCLFVASDVFAPLTREVDHVRKSMFAAMCLCAALGAVVCESIAPGVFAPLAHEVDHVRKLMFATMSLFAALGAVGCLFVASDMFAPCTHEVDHFREFMFATTSLLAALGAAGCGSLASVMAASWMYDINESMLFAVHCATCRCLPLRAITRLFLYRETFPAIRHIPKYVNYEIYAWP